MDRLECVLRRHWWTLVLALATLAAVVWWIGRPPKTQPGDPAPACTVVCQTPAGTSPSAGLPRTKADEPTDSARAAEEVTSSVEPGRLCLHSELPFRRLPPPQLTTDGAPGPLTAQPGEPLFAESGPPPESGAGDDTWAPDPPVLPVHDGFAAQPLQPPYESAPLTPPVPLSPPVPPMPDADYPAERSEDLERTARQADRHTYRGFELAGRRAYYAARAEFIGALRLVAEGLDAEYRTTAHSRSLAAGLTAIKEAEDFVPVGSRLEADLDLAAIVGGHRTPVLKTAQTDRLTPRTALSTYFTFAQEQLAAAAGREVAGSMALHALGKLHVALSGGPSARGDVGRHGRDRRE